MKISLRWVLAVLVAALGIGYAGGAIAAKEAAKMVQWSLDDIKWQTAPNAPPGMQQAEAYKKGAMHCSFNKFPKGTEVPTHTHTNDIASVVLAGTFRATHQAGEGKAQPAGSFPRGPRGHQPSTNWTAGRRRLPLFRPPA